MTPLLAAVCSVVAGPLGQLLPQTGPPSAVIWKEQLFCSTPGATRYRGALYRGAFDARQKRIRDPITHETWAVYYGDTLAKLDIVGDRILFHTTEVDHYIAPLTALPRIEDSTFGKYLDQEAERILKLAGKENCFPYHGVNVLLLNPMHRAADYTPPPFPFDPVNHRGRPGDWHKPEIRQIEAMNEYIREARFSLQIAGPNTVRLFHAVKDKLFVSVEPDYLGLPLPTPEEKVPKAPDRELRVGKLPAGFDGHFAAYRVGEKEYTDYLVTRAGKVFACVPKGKDEVVITPIWDDPKRKVYGVLRDTDGAVYGFGYVGVTTNPNRFRVKFEAKPEAKAYSMTAPLHFEPEDTYREAYECARAVAKAKK